MLESKHCLINVFFNNTPGLGAVYINDVKLSERSIHRMPSSEQS